MARRPRLALPFTVLASPDSVRLVAGEDFRYTLTGPELDDKSSSPRSPGPIHSAVNAPTRDVVLGAAGSDHPNNARAAVATSGDRTLPCTFHAAAKFASASATPVLPLAP